MRIEINNYLALNKINLEKKSTEKSKKSILTSNEDKIEFSSQSVKKDYTLSEAKASVVSSVNNNVSSERLEEIKNKIKSGEYYVPSSKVASSILGRI